MMVHCQVALHRRLPEVRYQVAYHQPARARYWAATRCRVVTLAPATDYCAAAAQAAEAAPLRAAVA